MWCGDVVLVRNKVGTVIASDDSSYTLAMCDGTTTVVTITDITAVVSTALDIVKEFEKAICSQVQ